MPQLRSRNAVPTGRVGLPAAERRAGPALAAALAERRSVRDFGARALASAELGQLAWAAQGVTDAEAGGRTAPSAGALYPLELYLATSSGLAHYIPAEHRLEPIVERDLRPELARAALGQEAVAAAACVFIFGAVPSRTTRKYGGRGLRYVYLEAGHAAQNLLLEAAALGLGAVPIGAFDDARLGAVLGLRKGEQPVYLVAVGARD